MNRRYLIIAVLWALSERMYDLTLVAQPFFPQSQKMCVKNGLELVHQSMLSDIHQNQCIYFKLLLENIVFERTISLDIRIK